MKMIGWETTPEMENDLKQLWVATDIDNNYNARSYVEWVNFAIGTWAYLIQMWSNLGLIDDNDDKIEINLSFWIVSVG